MRRQLGKGMMRTLQAASWWLIFGQPSPLKTLASSNLANISEGEPPPLNKSERNPNSAGSDIEISESDQFTPVSNWWAEKDKVSSFG